MSRGSTTVARDRTGDPSSAWLANAGSLVVGRLVVAVLGWIGTIIVARNLDADEFGRFVFVFGLLGMMTVVTDLGLGRIALSGVMGEVADEVAGGVGAGPTDREGFAGAYIVLRAVLGLVGYGVAVGFTVIGGYPSEIVTATAVAGAVVIVATASHAYEVILQAKLRMGIVAVAAIIGRSAQLALITVAVIANGSLLVLILPAIAAEIVIAAVKIPAALRLQPVRYAIRPELWWRLLTEAVPISLGTALATLYFRVDSIMLSQLADFTAVAVYGIAFKFVDLLHFLSLSISAPLLTVLVLAWPDRPLRFRRSVEQICGLLVIGAGGLIVVFGPFAADVLELLYGARYVTADGDAGTVLQLLIVGEIIALASMVGLTALTATANHRPYPYLALAGLVTNVGLNLVAIPRWGILGAAVTTVVTEAVVVVGMWQLVKRVPGHVQIPIASFLMIVPAIGAGLTVGWLVALIAPWPLAALAGLAVYGATTLVLVVFVIPPSVDPPGFGQQGFGQQGFGQPRADRSEPVEATLAPPAGSVVLVGHSRSGSGAELVAIRYADAMLAAGWQVEAVCPEGVLAERLRERGLDPTIIPDLQLPTGPRPVAAIRMIARWVRAGRTIARLTDGDDVLVVNGLLALPAVRLAGRSRSAMWLVHDVVIRSDLRLVARAGARHVGAAAAVSGAAAAFPTSLGVPTTVVRNGTAWPVDPADQPDDGPPIVGIAAKVTPWKGHHVLLDAVAGLPEVELHVLGGRFPKDAPYVDRLQERASRPDLAGRVRFLGHTDDPLAAMRSWTIAVSASVDPEAGPLAVLEAMSLGLPIVATDHGGAVEVLGDAGLLVEPNDVDAMRDGLRLLLDDPGLRARCAAAGRAAIDAGLTEQASNRSFLAVVAALAAERAAR